MLDKVIDDLLESTFIYVNNSNNRSTHKSYKLTQELKTKKNTTLRLTKSECKVIYRLKNRVVRPVYLDFFNYELFKFSYNKYRFVEN